jgi:hypothetical protein
MLAEIFMMRLEAAARALKDTLPSSTSQFVSFASNNQVPFKETESGLQRLCTNRLRLQKD